MASEPEPATEAVAPKSATQALIEQFQLTVIDGVEGDVGMTFQTSGGSGHRAVDKAVDRAVLGTHESADLVLKDPTVSRFHCEITVADGRILVRDLGSRNGTLVENVSVIQAELRPGAVLTLGRTRIRFGVGSEKVELPLSRRERFGVMVGRSQVMRAAFARLERAAASDATVLLTGETGTGKEAAAESIHGESDRAEGPFVVVDCSAIPPTLLESELFGHTRGAFTGAASERRGAFEEANGGTIFLDEIGELASDIQPKLLRALDRREIKPVGANRQVAIDARVIAATNRNLRSEVNAGRFRADLYYRVAVLEVRLPPLRERLEDLPLLVEHILRGLDASDRDEAEALRRSEFQAHLAQQSWPGNVRELRNYVERCLAFEEPIPNLPADDTGDAPRADVTQPLRAAREAWVRVFERQYLEEMLRQHDGNVTAAAHAAGVNRIYFYRLLWKHRLR